MHGRLKVELDNHYGESAPSIMMAYKWFGKFRSDDMNTNDPNVLNSPLKPQIQKLLRNYALKDVCVFFHYHFNALKSTTEVTVVTTVRAVLSKGILEMMLSNY